MLSTYCSPAYPSWLSRGCATRSGPASGTRLIETRSEPTFTLLRYHLSGHQPITLAALEELRLGSDDPGVFLEAGPDG